VCCLGFPNGRLRLPQPCMRRGQPWPSRDSLALLEAKTKAESVLPHRRAVWRSPRTPHNEPRLQVRKKGCSGSCIGREGLRCATEVALPQLLRREPRSGARLALRRLGRPGGGGAGALDSRRSPHRGLLGRDGSSTVLSSTTSRIDPTTHVSECQRGSPTPRPSHSDPRRARLRRADAPPRQRTIALVHEVQLT
jgi:hypothetical protein